MFIKVLQYVWYSFLGQAAQQLEDLNPYLKDRKEGMHNKVKKTNPYFKLANGNTRRTSAGDIFYWNFYIVGTWTNFYYHIPFLGL